MSHKHYRKEKDCLNCGQIVEDKFCSHCGQENIEIKEPFWTFVSHGVGHYFHYDSKFKRTLRPFLTKPGQLTKDHIAGKRASHIPPISLYLFITLVYFLFAPIFQKVNQESNRNFNYRYNPQTKQAELVEKDEDTEDSLHRVFESKPYSDQASQIKMIEDELKTAGMDSTMAEEWTDLLADYKALHTVKNDSTVAAYRIRQAALPEKDKDDFFERFYIEGKIRYEQKTGEKFDSDKIIDKYYPKLLFILMPLFAFFLMLNFRKNKKLYMEHLIFTIHLFSFAYFSLFISDLLQYLSPQVIDVFIGLAWFGFFTWYLYRSIRLFYERKRWVTVRKLFSVSMLFGIAFMISYFIVLNSVILIT